MQFNYCADYIYAQRCYLEKSRGGRGSANQQLGVSQSARTAIQFGFHAMPLWKFQLSTADFGVAFARHNYSAARLFVFKKYRHMLFFSSKFILQTTGKGHHVYSNLHSYAVPKPHVPPVSCVVAWYFRACFHIRVV